MQSALLQPEEQVLTTLNRDGSRNWLYPRLSPGRFLAQRRALAYVLIGVFTLIPYFKVAGKPLLLFDFANREFTLFGFTFLPTDTVLVTLFFVSLFVTIFLLTALFGRVWCGWACPQTVYMEFVYRPIERLFAGTAGRGGRPARKVTGWRLPAMYGAYALVSMFLAHTFLAYFVGVDALIQWVQRSPFEHPGSFLLMVGVTAGMMFNFAYFREQTCIVACPYGRFQSVLLDRHSLIVSYDPRRGEPRGKGRGPRPETAAPVTLPVQRSAAEPAALGAAPRGDCVDCGLCVTTCPTGIDIRKGLQMECVNCAQCIDACDAVMDRLGKPRGLIRYGSQASIAGAPRRMLRPRVIFYPAILAIVLVIFAGVLLSRSRVDVSVIRNLGAPFTVLDTGEVSNAIRVKITNRTERPETYRLEVVASGASARLILSEPELTLAPREAHTEGLQVIVPSSVFTGGRQDVLLRVHDSQGLARELTLGLLGPSIPATGGAAP